MTSPLSANQARQTQLLLELLRSTRPLSGNELFELVPKYRQLLERDGRTKTLEKMFERDREALAASGFQLDVVPDPQAPEDRARWRFQLNSSSESIALVQLDAEQTLLIDAATRVWLDAQLVEDARRGYLKLLPSGVSGAKTPASRPTAAVFTHPLFAQLRSAITSGDRLSFAYLKQEQTVPQQRIVDPLRLIVKSGRWLLHAWDINRAAYRTYLVNRIVSEPQRVGAVDPTHQADPHIDEQLDALAAANPVQLLVASGTEAEARMLRRGRELERSGQWVRVEVHDWDHGLLADELAGLGQLVTVESPLKLAAGVRSRLQRALALHGTESAQ